MIDLTSTEFWNNVRDDPMWESDKAHQEAKAALDLWHEQNPEGCHLIKLESSYADYDWLRDQELDGKIYFEAKSCALQNAKCRKVVDDRKSNCMKDLKNYETWELIGESEIW
jgi:hypothetical protein